MAQEIILQKVLHLLQLCQRWTFAGAEKRSGRSQRCLLAVGFVHAGVLLQVGQLEHGLGPDGLNSACYFSYWVERDSACDFPHLVQKVKGSCGLLSPIRCCK